MGSHQGREGSGGGGALPPRGEFNPVALSIVARICGKWEKQTTAKKA